MEQAPDMLHTPDRSRDRASNSADNKSRASTLTKLLRSELRDACFSVTHLAPTNTQFVPGDDGDGSISSNLEETSREELDAQGLKALHQGGTWKRESFQSDIRVEALCCGSESTTRLKEFERLLDDIGVLSEGCVAHALGSIIPTHYSSNTGGTNSPGTSIGVSETVKVWSYLLVDACLNTPRCTANKLLRWVQGAPLAFETRVLLGRLNAASSFALKNGLAVERLPHRQDSLEGWFATGSGMALSDYLDRTMLRIPCKISPFLSRPTKVTERDGTPINSWETLAEIEVTWPLPFGGIYELSRALSLVCNVEVETLRIWSDYSGHAHFGQRLSRSWYRYGSGELLHRTDKNPTLTAHDLKKALLLQPKLRYMPNDVKAALKYWLKSKSDRPELADRLVFLRTALEALFLDDGNRAELTFRLATNGAWYTGRNPEERQQRYDTLKEVYNAASGAVHSGRAKKAAEKLLTDGQDICRWGILKRLRSAQVPVWKNIIFGR